MSFKEPCMCGAYDCVRCRGSSAKYYNWCEECEYSIEEGGDCDPDEVEPGSYECDKKSSCDAAEDAYEEDKLERKRHGWDY